MARRSLKLRALLFLYGNGNILGCALALAGPTWTALLAMSLPVCLYATLAIAESRHLAKHPAPRRTAPHDATSGGWRSEWASFVPPLAAWSIVQFLSTR